MRLSEEIDPAKFWLFLVGGLITVILGAVLRGC
jgi:hypothetical protein